MRFVEARLIVQLETMHIYDTASARYAPATTRGVSKSPSGIMEHSKISRDAVRCSSKAASFSFSLRLFRPGIIDGGAVAGLGSTFRGCRPPLASDATTDDNDDVTSRYRGGVVLPFLCATPTPPPTLPIGETTKCHDNDDGQQQLEFHSFYKRRGESALATM